MTRALFLRHGKATDYFATGEYDALSPVGVEQSEKLGAWLAAQRLSAAACLVGPRRRHAQTYEAAARASQGLGVVLAEPVAVDELDEHDGLNLVRKLLPALAADEPAVRELLVIAARGETPAPQSLFTAFKKVARRWIRGELHHDDVEPWAAFRARVVRAMGRVAELGRGGTVLVFTSAGVVAGAVGVALGLPDERVLDLCVTPFNASCTELVFGEEGWELRTFNETAHLEPRLVTLV